jgi:hypothetical protein
MGVILLALLAFSAAVASAASSTRPSLRLMDRSPVSVRGAGFLGGERVTVHLSAGSRSSKVVTAGGRGGFVARFARSLPRCTRYSVQAFGSKGSRASLRSGIAPDCQPQG